MFASHGTSPLPSASVSALAGAASSSTTPKPPKSFDTLTTHRVSTIGFVGVHTSEAHARRKARRSADSHLTSAERLVQKKSDWSIPEPTDQAHVTWVLRIIAYMRTKQYSHLVYVGVSNETQAATGAVGGQWSMALMTMRDAVAMTFAEIEDEEERWTAFQEYLTHCIRINAEGTAVVLGDYVAHPIAVKSDRVAASRLLVKYTKYPTKASFAKSSTLAHAPQRDKLTITRAIIVDLPATLSCGHHVPVLSNAWPTWPKDRKLAFCIKCLDPVLDHLQSVELPRYTPDEWAAWIAAEEKNANLDRMAALADLRAFPWFSREWLQAARMIGVMFGVKDAFSPEFAATMAISTNARLEASR